MSTSLLAVRSYTWIAVGRQVVQIRVWKAFIKSASLWAIGSRRGSYAIIRLCREEPASLWAAMKDHGNKCRGPCQPILIDRAMVCARCRPGFAATRLWLMDRIKMLNLATFISARCSAFIWLWKFLNDLISCSQTNTCCSWMSKHESQVRLLDSIFVMCCIHLDLRFAWKSFLRW